MAGNTTKIFHNTLVDPRITGLIGGIPYIIVAVIIFIKIGKEKYSFVRQEGYRAMRYDRVVTVLIFFTSGFTTFLCCLFKTAAG